MPAEVIDRINAIGMRQKMTTKLTYANRYGQEIEDTIDELQYDSSDDESSYTPSDDDSSTYDSDEESMPDSDDDDNLPPPPDEMDANPDINVGGKIVNLPTPEISPQSAGVNEQPATSRVEQPATSRVDVPARRETTGVDESTTELVEPIVSTPDKITG